MQFSGLFSYEIFNMKLPDHSSWSNLAFFLIPLLRVGSCGFFDTTPPCWILRVFRYQSSGLNLAVFRYQSSGPDLAVFPAKVSIHNNGCARYRRRCETVKKAMKKREKEEKTSQKLPFRYPCARSSFRDTNSVIKFQIFGILFL